MKLGLIPHIPERGKALWSLWDRAAAYQVVGGVKAYQADDA